MLEDIKLSAIQDENARQLIRRLLNLIEKLSADLHPTKACVFKNCQATNLAYLRLSQEVQLNNRRKKMKNKLIHFVAIIMVITLSACGAAPAPTMSAVDIQGTAVSAAWTVVAMTQSAIPTATLIPTEMPSPTPLPTFTPLPPPTLAFPTQSVLGAPTSIPPGGATADPCNQFLPANAPGHYVKVEIVNKTTGTAKLSLALTEMTAFGVCGFRGFVIGPNESPVLSILEGCYYAQAYVDGKKPSTPVGGFCVRADGHKWQVKMTADTIGF